MQSNAMAGPIPATGDTTNPAPTQESKPGFKNQAIIDFYSAPINVHVDLNEHKLILKDISKEEKDRITYLTACAIFLGDVKAATYFKMQIDNQKMTDSYKKPILQCVNTMLHIETLKTVLDKGIGSPEETEQYAMFCQYAVRFECHRGVSSVLHPCNQEETLKMFSLHPTEEKKSDITPSTLTLTTILRMLKRQLSNTGNNNTIICFNHMKSLSSNEGAILHQLFTEGKYLDFYALMNRVLQEENTLPPFVEIVLHNNSETFASAMAELKFTKDCPEANRLMKIAILKGKTHAVEYFYKLGIKFHLDDYNEYGYSSLYMALRQKYDSLIDLYLKIKSSENNYPEIIKEVRLEAIHAGNLDIVKKLTENQKISPHEILANPYQGSWDIRYYLTCKIIDTLIKEKELTRILFALIHTANTKERIESLLVLLNDLRHEKKINLLKIIGDTEILQAFLFFISKNHLNPESKENTAAKIQLMSFFLQEDKATTQALLQKPAKDNLCLLICAVRNEAHSEIMNYLIELHESHNVPLPAALLVDAIENLADDELIHKLWMEKKLELTTNPNAALNSLVNGANRLSPIPFKNSKKKEVNMSWLYECHGADPFCPIGLAVLIDTTKIMRTDCVVQSIGEHHNLGAIKCLIAMYQIYFDKVSDMLRQFLEPNELNHLVLSYANNTPYFASLNFNQFFAYKLARKKLLDSPGTVVLLEQEKDKPKGYSFTAHKS